MRGGSHGADDHKVDGEVLMQEFVDMAIIGDSLVLASIGFVAGCVMPFAFRLVGAVLDAGRKFSK